MKYNAICTVTTWSDRFQLHGRLSILYVNDTLYLIEYKDSERSITVDLDHVSIDSSTGILRFIFPRNSNDELLFIIEDTLEINSMIHAQQDCQAICELKLRMNSVLRDCYYAGLYTTLDKDAKIFLCEEIEKLKHNNPSIYFTSLLNSPIVTRDMKSRPPSSSSSTTMTTSKSTSNYRNNNHGGDNNNHNITVGSNETNKDTNHDNSNSSSNSNNDNNNNIKQNLNQEINYQYMNIPITDVICIFCNASRTNNKDLNFIIHPYVSKTSKSKIMYMCNICIENWKDYREKAEHENQLILENQINEEICAICSVTPPELILCSECSRSFCYECLLKILTKSEMNELKRNPEWLCICCNQQPPLPKHPSLNRSSWKVYLLNKSNAVYGCIVPYMRNNKNNNHNHHSQHNSYNNNNDNETTSGTITIAKAAKFIETAIINDDNIVKLNKSSSSSSSSSSSFNIKGTKKSSIKLSSTISSTDTIPADAAVVISDSGRIQRNTSRWNRSYNDKYSSTIINNTATKNYHNSSNNHTSRSSSSSSSNVIDESPPPVVTSKRLLNKLKNKKHNVDRDHDENDSVVHDNLDLNNDDDHNTAAMVEVKKRGRRGNQAYNKHITNDDNDKSSCIGTRINVNNKNNKEVVEVMTALPAINTAQSEEFYFAQFVSYYRNFSRQMENHMSELSLRKMGLQKKRKIKDGIKNVIINMLMVISCC